MDQWSLELHKFGTVLKQYNRANFFKISTLNLEHNLLDCLDLDFLAAFDHTHAYIYKLYIINHDKQIFLIYYYSWTCHFQGQCSRGGTDC